MDRHSLDDIWIEIERRRGAGRETPEDRLWQRVLTDMGYEPPGQPTAARRRGGKAEAVRRVLADLYPGGIPDHASLPSSLLCRAVAARLPFLVSDMTIRRAAGRR
jgi:hypothetical protein